MYFGMSGKTSNVHMTPNRIIFLNKTTKNGVELKLMDGDDGKITIYLNYKQIEFLGNSCIDIPNLGMLDIISQ